MLDEIFENLNYWRNFPSYQLERRIDIFFSVYLNEIIENWFQYNKESIVLNTLIIPEFPIKKHLIEKLDTSNKSYKVDFVCFSKNLNEVFLVELKTDMGSRRNNQDKYLIGAQEVGIKKMLEGLVDIFQNSKSRKKYYYLFNALENIGLVELPKDLKKKVFSRSRHQKKLIQKIKIYPNKIDTRVIYIQPNVGNNLNHEEVITYDFVIEVLNKKNDKFSRLFLTHLINLKKDSGNSFKLDTYER